MSTGREMTFEDVLRYVGQEATRPGERGGAVPRPPGPLEGTPGPPRPEDLFGGVGGGGGCGSASCGCRGSGDDAALAAVTSPVAGFGASEGGASGRAQGAGRPRGPTEMGAESATAPMGGSAGDDGVGGFLEKPVDRRGALGMLFGAVAAGTQAVSACSPTSLLSAEEREAKLLEWEEYFKGNFRLMSEEERAATISRLERLSELRRGVDVSIDSTPARPGVIYGYAFNISKCKGYRNCVEACIQENNLDRSTAAQYIRIFELEEGTSINDLDHGDATFHHEVPAAGHFYLGTQCFQCANPPCVEVCPVGATWQEPDGITVVDYDWCIGCRYCMAACPYWARRFNWGAPEVPAEELNPNQHYLGNRPRKSGVVEKCTFCVQRTRQGRLPACAEACPTGARVFGNLLDPDSEIRWVLENKQVFRLKEDLNTEPRFWYFMD
ncbi:MAG: 4Fe-4S dicluster domain-containing protein [Gemmatimonadota bacterium]